MVSLGKAKEWPWKVKALVITASIVIKEWPKDCKGAAKGGPLRDIKGKDREIVLWGCI